MLQSFILSVFVGRQKWHPASKNPAPAIHRFFTATSGCSLSPEQWTSETTVVVTDPFEE